MSSIKFVSWFISYRSFNSTSASNSTKVLLFHSFWIISSPWTSRAFSFFLSFFLTKVHLFQPNLSCSVSKFILVKAEKKKKKKLNLTIKMSSVSFFPWFEWCIRTYTTCAWVLWLISYLSKARKHHVYYSNSGHQVSGWGGGYKDVSRAPFSWLVYKEICRIYMGTQTHHSF